jgi:phenylacetic acid degradation operon negative regulatory protein
VVRAFDLEDFYPDDSAGSARLPRRQAGGSSTGLAVTLIADYTLRACAWLPSAAIVDLLGEFEVPAGAARTTISRLARRGVLEGSRQGRYSSYRLTKDAAIDLRNGGGSIVDFTMHPDSWDGSWTVITFSVPETQSTQRRGLRTELRWRGFAPLYDAVWVSPHPLEPWRRADLAKLALGAMTVFRSQHVQLETQADLNPIYAWDLPGISHQYETFIRRWNRLLPRISAGKVTGAAAVRARTEVMDTYRRFPVLDPLLPIELLPPSWPRARARETCTAVYDGLAEPAQDHVRSVVSRYSDASPTDIQAHTIAGMVMT